MYLFRNNLFYYFYLFRNNLFIPNLLGRLTVYGVCIIVNIFALGYFKYTEFGCTYCQKKKNSKYIGRVV